METKRCMKIWITAVAMMAMCVCIAAPFSAAYESSLKGYWALNTNANPTSDAVTPGDNGTVVGATWTALGKFSGAFSFDGNSDYINYGDVSALDFNQQSFTISAWIKPSTISGNQMYNIASKWTPGGRQYSLYVRGSDANLPNRIMAETGSGSSDWGGYSSSQISAGSWWHVVCVYSDSASPTISIYINGIADGSWDSGRVGNTSSSFRIGSRDDGSGALNYFNGLIDDTAIWNRPLAADEIRFLGSSSGNSVQTFEDTYASAGTSSGNWGTAGSWRAGIVPVSGKEVHLDSASTVTVDSAQASNSVYMGDVSGESGTLNINTGGTLTVGGTINDGAGTSNLTLNGGTLTLNGVGTSSVDNFTFTGGTMNLNNGTFANNIVNGAGTSTLNINGGSLSGSSIDVDNLNIGTTATGSLSLGNSKSLTAGSMNVGSLGTFTLNGGTLTAGGVSGTGVFNMQSGTLKLNGAFNGPTFNMTGGDLKGTGELHANIVIPIGGIIAPGNSPGTDTIYGNFTLNGTLEAELGGIAPGAQYDQILVYGGDVVLGSGSVIKLIPWSGFTPTIGDTFTLIDWDTGGFANNGYTVDTSLFGPANYWSFSQNGSSFQAQYTAGVPEPSSMAVSGLVFGLLGLIRRSRKAKK